MIARIIRCCIANRIAVLLAVAALATWGLWAMLRTPVDALPDLSDVQVIIRTTYPGQAPEIVENQITYPLATTMMSVPGAKTVRGYSMFGDSFVYVLFEDGTDLYWARSRVLEYLNQVQARLPKGATAALGPDATGVGWIYEYALIDRSHRQDISQLRARGRPTSVSIRSPGPPGEKPGTGMAMVRHDEVSIRSPGPPGEKHPGALHVAHARLVSIRSPGPPGEKRLSVLHLEP